MNPQSHQPSQSADACIDRILDALRTTEAPSGLEQRIAERIASRNSARSLEAASAYPSSLPFIAANNPNQTPLFAVILRAVIRDSRILLAQLPSYILAASALTLLLSLSLFTFHAHHKSQSIAQSQLLSLPAKPQTPPRRINLAQTRPNARERLNHRPHAEEAQPLADPNDPDMIALAETVAPSHPAPPMPLTPQERLLLSATRKGAPIEVAELEVTREPAFRAAAEIREKAGMQQFARNLLATLAISESLESTPQNDIRPSTSSSFN